MKKGFIIIGLIFYFASCNNCSKNFSEIYNLWMLTSVDSIYYEYYFDRYQQFVFVGKTKTGSIIYDYDSVIFNNFINEMLTNKSLKEDSCSVLTYFSNNIVKNKTFVTVKPVASLCYKFTEDIPSNYLLFCSESYQRYSKFKKLGLDSLAYPFKVNFENTMKPNSEFLMTDTVQFNKTLLFNSK